MPFLFPPGKCAGRRFQRGLSLVTQTCRHGAPVRLTGLGWAGPAQPVVPRPWLGGGSCGPGDEGSFLGLCVLICPLSLPPLPPSTPDDYICHIPSVLHVNSHCVPLLLRTLPPLRVESKLLILNLEALYGLIPSTISAPGHMEVIHSFQV